jgi:hypothetical protein
MRSRAFRSSFSVLVLLAAIAGCGGPGTPTQPTPERGNTLKTAGVPQQTAATAPRGTEVIEVFSERDFVSVEGLPANQALVIEIYRPNLASTTPETAWKLIGQAAGSTDATGFVEVNHPGGLCWNFTEAPFVGTPDIQGGDVLVVAWDADGDGVLEQQRETVTKDMSVRPAYVIHNTNGTARVEVVGKARVPAGVDPDVFLSQMEQSFVNPDRFPDGRRGIGASTAGSGVGLDGKLEWTNRDAGDWKATWDNLTPDETTACMNADVSIDWIGAATPGGEGNEITSVEITEEFGPFGPCAPYALNAATQVIVGGVPASARDVGLRINAGHVASGALVRFTGVAQPDAGAPGAQELALFFPPLALDAAAPTATVAVPLATCATSTAWDWVTGIPANDPVIAGLPDGFHEVLTRFRLAGNITIKGAPVRMVKDTVPPDLAFLSSVSGTSAFVVIRSASDPDATFTISTNGGATFQPYTGRVQVPLGASVIAQAIDKAGNTASHTATIGTPGDIDTTAPTLTASLSAPAGQQARFRNPGIVTVTSDDPAAVVTIEAFRNAETAAFQTVTNVGTATIVIARPEGGRSPVYTLRWKATDAAGNTSVIGTSQYRF